MKVQPKGKEPMSLTDGTRVRVIHHDNPELVDTVGYAYDVGDAMYRIMPKRVEEEQMVELNWEPVVLCQESELETIAED